MALVWVCIFSIARFRFVFLLCPFLYRFDGLFVYVFLRSVSLRSALTSWFFFFEFTVLSFALVVRVLFGR